MDLLVCKLNADPTESLLERNNLDRFRLAWTLPFDIQKNAFKAKSQLLLVLEGEKTKS